MVKASWAPQVKVYTEAVPVNSQFNFGCGLYAYIIMSCTGF